MVLQDWTDAVMAEQRSAAVRALAQKYTVKTDGARRMTAAMRLLALLLASFAGERRAARTK